MEENKNGQKENQPKLCPFINESCIGEKCELFTQMRLGVKQIGMCSFNAMTIIFSEINQKIVSPQQTFQMPKGLYRG